jgi:hypothetical protein
VAAPLPRLATAPLPRLAVPSRRTRRARMVCARTENAAIRWNRVIALRSARRRIRPLLVAVPGDARGRRASATNLPAMLRAVRVGYRKALFLEGDMYCAIGGTDFAMPSVCARPFAANSYMSVRRNSYLSV